MAREQGGPFGMIPGGAGLPGAGKPETPAVVSRAGGAGESQAVQGRGKQDGTMPVPDTVVGKKSAPQPPAGSVVRSPAVDAPVGTVPPSGDHQDNAPRIFALITDELQSPEAIGEDSGPDRDDTAPLEVTAGKSSNAKKRRREQARMQHARIGDTSADQAEKVTDSVGDGGGDFPSEGRGGREGDPQEKPFKLFIAGDVYKSIPALHVWGQSLERMLQECPEGKKVAVVYAWEEGTQQQSQAITNEISEDVEPSLAVQHARGFISQGRFDYDKAMILDDLQNRFGERLLVIPEWQPEENADNPLAEELRLSVKENLTDAELTKEREKLYARAALRRQRNTHLKEIITDALAQEDVIGGVGLGVYSQTDVSHELSAEGYSADRFIPESQHGTLYFSPVNTLERMAEQSDRMLTNDAISLAYRGEMKALGELRENGWKDEQGVIRRTHQWMREQIKKRRNGQEEPVEAGQEEIEHSVRRAEKVMFVDVGALRKLESATIVPLHGDREPGVLTLDQLGSHRARFEAQIRTPVPVEEEHPVLRAGTIDELIARQEERLRPRGEAFIVPLHGDGDPVVIPLQPEAPVDEGPISPEQTEQAVAILETFIGRDPEEIASVETLEAFNRAIGDGELIKAIHTLIVAGSQTIDGAGSHAAVEQTPTGNRYSFYRTFFRDGAAFKGIDITSKNGFVRFTVSDYEVIGERKEGILEYSERRMPLVTLPTRPVEPSDFLSPPTASEFKVTLHDLRSFISEYGYLLIPTASGDEAGSVPEGREDRVQLVSPELRTMALERIAQMARISPEEMDAISNIDDFISMFGHLGECAHLLLQSAWENGNQHVTAYELFEEGDQEESSGNLAGIKYEYTGAIRGYDSSIMDAVSENGFITVNVVGAPEGRGDYSFHDLPSGRSLDEDDLGLVSAEDLRGYASLLHKFSNDILQIFG